MRYRRERESLELDKVLHWYSQYRSCEHPAPLAPAKPGAVKEYEG